MHLPPLVGLRHCIGDTLPVTLNDIRHGKSTGYTTELTVLSVRNNVAVITPIWHRTKTPMILWFFTSLLLIVLAGGLILFALGYSFGTIADFEGHNATITCFHCGQETQVGRKTCEWCHKELQ